MLVASFFSWWYGAGWRLCARQVSRRLSRTSEFFSITLLLKTLFAPYRQISAGGVRGNITVQLRAFLDRTVSRFVGFFVRMIVLVAGLASLTVSLVGGALWLLLWPLMPVLPIVMIAFTLTGFPQ